MMNKSTGTGEGSEISHFDVSSSASVDDLSPVSNASYNISQIDSQNSNSSNSSNSSNIVRSKNKKSTGRNGNAEIKTNTLSSDSKRFKKDDFYDGSAYQLAGPSTATNQIHVSRKVERTPEEQARFLEKDAKRKREYRMNRSPEQILRDTQKDTMRKRRQRLMRRLAREAERSGESSSKTGGESSSGDDSSISHVKNKSYGIAKLLEVSLALDKFQSESQSELNNTNAITSKNGAHLAEMHSNKSWDAIGDDL
jgi:hypothetical protein